MLYIGIDTGLDGGIAALDDAGLCVYTARMPVLKGKRPTVAVLKLATLIHNLHAEWCDVFVVAEAPVPGGVNSTAMTALSQGESIGVIKGIVAVLGIPAEYPRPTTWQKVLPPLPKGKTKKTGNAKADAKARQKAKAAWKHEVINAAARRWPLADLVGSSAANAVPHSGIADALWIAEYGRLLRNGGAG